MARRRTYGFSFSWRRAIGLSGFKGKVSRATGIPMTRGGMERKVGRSLIRFVTSLFGIRY